MRMQSSAVRDGGARLSRLVVVPVVWRAFGRRFGVVLVVLAAISAAVAGCDLATVPPSSPSASTPGGSASAVPSASTPGQASPGTPSAGSPLPASPSFALPTASPAPTPIAYTVVGGDSLGTIARRFSTTPRSIAFWNRTTYPNLDPYSKTYDPNRIEVGWVLSVIPGVVFDENDLPTPSPSARPSISIPPGPTPDPSGTSVLISHGARASNAVALTFDMGGRLDPALDIVDWLVAHDVPATVFPTGQTVSGTQIGHDVLVRVAAHPDLFDVGDHSWDHPDFTKLTPARMIDQLTRTEAVVEPIVGRTTKPFFRPPYGAQDEAVRAAVGGAGWTYTIMWDVDTIDWKPTTDGGPTADDIAAKVAARARGGSIVLMHLGGYNTLAALPQVLAALADRGLQPVTLSQLLGR